MEGQRTLRSKRLRNLLWIHQDGKCAICGAPLPATGWHADHKVPWSKGGKTNIHEMQATCAKCNLKKGDRMADRQHQAELRELVSRLDSSEFPAKILAHVVPGGGKSRLPGIIASQFKDHKILWFVPRLSLQSQAVESLRKDFGIIVRDSGNDVDPTRGTRGCVVTHQSLTQQPKIWTDLVDRFHGRVIVAVDECHHAKTDRRTGKPSQLAAALSGLRPNIWLDMTGTLETGDGEPIYGMKYRDSDGGLVVDADKSADHFIRYSRQSALGEKAVVPIEFYHHDGPVNWQRMGELASRGGRLSEISHGEEREAIFAALRTDYAGQVFSGGLEHWRRQKNGGKLIVCVFEQTAARTYAERLRCAGINVALAITDNPEAHEEVKRFRHDPSSQALVTCAMAYEGLDVPSATHLICLTHIRSAPWIEQMLARVWRSHRGKSKCWAFVPDDPLMNRVIERIKSEEPAALPQINPASPFETPGTNGKCEGEGFSTIMALHGSVDDIRQKLLDAGYAPDEITDKVVQFVRDFGLRGDEPEVAALMRRIREQQIPQAIPRTPREIEADLRKQIADTCRRLDREWAANRGVDPVWGKAQSWLFSQTGKSTTEMNEEELRRAFARLKNFRT